MPTPRANSSVLALGALCRTAKVQIPGLSQSSMGGEAARGRSHRFWYASAASALVLRASQSSDRASHHEGRNIPTRPRLSKSLSVHAMHNAARSQGGADNVFHPQHPVGEHPNEVGCAS